MQEISDSQSIRMGELNNALIALIDNTDCSVIEVITVLELVTDRLTRTFEMSVMGNPLDGLVKE